ncbi:predicted protein [Histoplasma mississippiense (nom. inval.)]|uniref:predicted protein n=1 Tax=Ajellomyces capsulatus (strain NAm1 / WU24) TaxID=2059318 RepID=UPI000157B48E|nr:predicted protein [Histoplasma mississippiense (nom. inval.)]EDN02781.1 predicted protein [Histoplasma mississippiense (nom. inval.)]
MYTAQDVIDFVLKLALLNDKGLLEAHGHLEIGTATIEPRLDKYGWFEGQAREGLKIGKFWELGCRLLCTEPRGETSVKKESAESPKVVFGIVRTVLARPRATMKEISAPDKDMLHGVNEPWGLRVVQESNRNDLPIGSLVLNYYVFAWNEVGLAPPSTLVLGPTPPPPWTMEEANITDAVVIILAASGKIAVVFAHQLKFTQPAGSQPRKIIAVTSQTSRAFVEATGFHDLEAVKKVGRKELEKKFAKILGEFLDVGGIPGLSMKMQQGMGAVAEGWDALCSGDPGPETGLMFKID